MSVVAIGNFDGVHRGHVRILRKTAMLAKELGTEALALTFTVHPRNVLMPGSVLLLTDPAERDSLIMEQGIDRVVALEFDPSFAQQSAADFLRRIVRDYGCTAIVCGENFRFGKDAAADVDVLRREGERLNLTVCAIPLEQNVSSTVIRNALAAGDIEQANRLLGRPYSVCETVVNGNHIGSTIGFPTLNQIVAESRVLPKVGVYATSVMLDGIAYPAVTNVGRRPTVEKNGKIVVETHVIGYSASLYGKQVRVSFFARLRDEQIFPSLDVLSVQLNEDMAQAQRIYEKNVKK